MQVVDGPDPANAVVAHGLISSVAVVTTAIESVLAYGPALGAEKVEELLRMALSQAAYLGDVLRDLARGLSPEVIDALDAIGERRPPPGP
jgi:hypothetical protein